MADPGALLVDLDGTLVDSLPLARAVYRRFARAAGFADTDAEFAALNGPALPEVVATLRARHGLGADAAVLLELYRGLFDQAYQAVAPKPGAADLLAAAARRGVRVVVVTSAGGALATRVLAAQGWGAYVAGVVSGDDVARAKPDPAIYRLALARAGCAPGAALALEDSVHGVRAAAGAAVPVVGVADGTPHAATPAALRAAGAARVVASLAEIFAAGAP